MRKHRALIDRSFVGYFADVKRGRFGKQDGAADACRRATTRIRKRVEKPLERLAHPRMSQNDGRRSVRRQLGRKLTTGFHVGDDQRGNFVAVGTGQHHVADKRRAMGGLVFLSCADGYFEET